LADRRDGVIVVDKPRGPTSHDVVAKARRALRTRPADPPQAGGGKHPTVGHAGTLDPMATGVLVLAIGQATKLVPFLSSDDKEYEATVALGVATDTLDAHGRETARAPLPPRWRDALDDALAAEKIRIMQMPPVFSAIHANGARSHERARRGESVDLAERPVRVLALAAIGVGEAEVRLRLTVSKGYYVRALARDLAARLGTVGHLTELRRLRSGAFSLEDAVPLDALGPDAPLIGLAEAAARVLPTCTLTEAGAAHARAGRRVPPTEMSTDAEGEHAWLAPDGALVAVGRFEDGAGRVTRGFG
jgi:tRNA pseudouridine55 synthase